MNKLIILSLFLVALTSQAKETSSTPKDLNGNGADLSGNSGVTEASTIAPGISCVACGRFEQGPSLMDANTAYRPGDSTTKEDSRSSGKAKTGK